jgi:hypothetical protein
MFQRADAAKGIPAPLSQYCLFGNTHNFFENTIQGMNTTLLIHYNDTAGKGIHEIYSEAIISEHLGNVIHSVFSPYKSKLSSSFSRKDI